MKAERSQGTATVLFSDLVGSTELLASMEEAAFDEFRRRHFAALRSAVERHGGEEIKTLGDGILAVFGSATDALAGAVAIQQAVDRQSRSGPHLVSVRIGLALGDVAFEDGDVFGAPVVEAARLVARARRGQILATTVVLVVAGRRSTFSFTDLGPTVLKGLPEAVPVSEVAWELLPVPCVPLPALLDEAGGIFVGREPELERLGRLWKDAEAGGRRVALLAGEPGAGKTRLAVQVARRVHAEGGVVLAGRCDEDLGVPFQPFVEALRHFVDHTPDNELLGRLGRFPGELARLVPELTVRLAALPPLLRSDPETERYRLFDAVAAWLATASPDRPVLLVLDDLQWAAKPTLLMLRHVLRPAGIPRLLVVATYRDTEMCPGHPLVAVLADLRRQEGVERFSVSGLDEEGVAAFMAKVASHPLRDEDLALAHAIHKETEGNPFFVREVLRHLIETGAIEPTAGRWALDHPLADLGIPEGVQEVVGRRLSRLSSDANRVLQTAAVIGPEFELAVLQATGALDEEILLGAVEEAVDARLIAEVSGPAPRYRFSHAVVRETLYEGITAARRVAAHTRVAGAIETVHATRIDGHLRALAHHWASAAVLGEQVRAAGWIRRAAGEAVNRLAYEEGVRLYRLALDVGGGELDDLERCQLLLALGAAQSLSGDHPGRLHTCRDAADLARSMARPDLIAEAALILDGGDGAAADRLVKRLCEEVLRWLGPQPSSLRARVAAGLARACIYLDDVDAAGRASEQALAMANQCDDRAAVVASLRARQLVCCDPDGAEERFGLAAQLLEIGQEAWDPETQMWAHLWRIDVMFQRGDLAGVGRELDPLAWCVDEVGGPVARWHLLRCQAAHAHAQARFAEAIRLANEGFTELIPLSAWVRDAVLAITGHHIGPEASGGARAFGLDGPVGARDFCPAFGVLYSLAPALMLISASRRAEAAGLYRALGPVAEWRPTTHGETISYALGIMVAAAMDAAEDIAAVRGLLARYRGHHVAGGAGAGVYLGPVELYLGIAARYLGLLDDAVADLDHARQVCAANGAAGYHVEALFELAMALARRAGAGDAARARSLAADCASRATTLGMPPFTTRAQQLADRLDQAPAKLLTPREREVSALVAQGLTNREIATRLYLSERTVENHVQHILTKLDLANRSQIAVWITSRS